MCLSWPILSRVTGNQIRKASLCSLQLQYAKMQDSTLCRKLICKRNLRAPHPTQYRRQVILPRWPEFVVFKEERKRKNRIYTILSLSLYFTFFTHTFNQIGPHLRVLSYQLWCPLSKRRNMFFNVTKIHQTVHSILMIKRWNEIGRFG
jgi:hypothetical protein